MREAVRDISLPPPQPRCIKNKNLTLPNSRNVATVHFPATSSGLMKLRTFTAVNLTGLHKQGLLTYLCSLTTSISRKENYAYCTRQFLKESYYNQFTTSSCTYCSVILPMFKNERYSALQHKTVYSIMTYYKRNIG